MLFFLLLFHQDISSLILISLNLHNLDFLSTTIFSLWIRIRLRIRASVSSFGIKHSSTCLYVCGIVSKKRSWFANYFNYLLTGRMPPKQLVRREPTDNSSSGSDSFDHRPIREHGMTSEPRMVWGSDPYPPTEPLTSPTPPKVQENCKEPRWVLKESFNLSYLVLISSKWNFSWSSL